MSPEIDYFIEEETEFNQFEGGAERVEAPEYPETEVLESIGGTRETADTSESVELIDPGEQAVIDQKGGETNYWGLHSRNESGHWFDGCEIRDTAGNSWTAEIESRQQPEDIALHHEMLAQWKEGGNAVFFLPDYVERTDDGEILYITFLKLDEGGRVSYEIWSHETKYHQHEEEIYLTIDDGDIERYAPPLLDVNESSSSAPTPEQNPPEELFREPIATVDIREEVSSDTSVPEITLLPDTISKADVPVTEEHATTEETQLTQRLQELFSSDLFELSSVPIVHSPETMTVAIETPSVRDTEKVASSVPPPAPHSEPPLDRVRTTDEISSPDVPVASPDAVQMIKDELPISAPRVAEDLPNAVENIVISQPVPPTDVSEVLERIIEAPIPIRGEMPHEEQTKIVAMETKAPESAQQTPLPLVREFRHAPLIPDKVAVDTIRHSERHSDALVTERPQTVKEQALDKPVHTKGVEHAPPPLHDSEQERRAPVYESEVLARALGIRISAPRFAEPAHRAANAETFRLATPTPARYAPIQNVRSSSRIVSMLNGITMRRTA